MKISTGVPDPLEVHVRQVRDAPSDVIGVRRYG